MIHREAWYKELLAYFGGPDLNDPESLEEFLREPYAYSVGFQIQALTDPDQGKWETVKHGLLAQGGFTKDTFQKLVQIPSHLWYLVQEHPPTWQINIQGKWPFGPTEWSIFGFSSKEWEALADRYESDFIEDVGIRGEFQFQLRPAGEFGDPGEARGEEALQNARMRAEDLMERLLRTQSPPSYASWLSGQYRDFRKFLGQVNLEDVDQMGRFLRMEKQLLDFHRDMNTAAEESIDSTRSPVVGVVPGLYEYILTGEGSPGVVPSEERRPGFEHGPHRR